MNGSGCPKCAAEKRGKGKRLSRDEFISKANVVHGGKYDYSKSIYATSKDKVIIICPIHGEFEQMPNSHISGSGCRDCGYDMVKHSQAIGLNEFLSRAKKAHGTFYDYSSVKYDNTKTKVEIICPTHGSFKQSPDSHMSGNGCFQCASKKKSDAHRRSLEDTLAQCNEVHGGVYEYKVDGDYVNSRSTFIITCSVHGEFRQQAASHISGQGCPKCGTIRQGKSTVRSQQYFLDKCKSIHGDLYDYSESVYTGVKNKVEISCSVHGAFWQSPASHYKGKGCPTCAKKSLIHYNYGNYDSFKDMNGYFYKVKYTSIEGQPHEEFFKKGITVEFNKRLCSLKKKEYDIDIVCLKEMKLGEAYLLELEHMIKVLREGRQYSPNHDIGGGKHECYVEKP
jgi:hypothetical protein